MATTTTTKRQIEVDELVAMTLGHMVDGSQWDMADYLVAQFPPDEWGDAENGVRTGLRAALYSYEVFIRDHLGVELAAPTMWGFRATALKWPATLRRTADASFDAHRAVRGEDRVSKLDAYIAHNGGRGLSAKDIYRMAADNKPKAPPTSWEVKATKRITSTVRSVMLGGGIRYDGDDFWRAQAVTDENRATIARILHDLANRITS